MLKWRDGSETFLPAISHRCVRQRPTQKSVDYLTDRIAAPAIIGPRTYQQGTVESSHREGLMSAAIGRLICFVFGHLDPGVFKEDGCSRCGWPSTAFCRLCSSHYQWR